MGMTKRQAFILMAIISRLSGTSGFARTLDPSVPGILSSTLRESTALVRHNEMLRSDIESAWSGLQNAAQDKHICQDVPQSIKESKNVCTKEGNYFEEYRQGPQVAQILASSTSSIGGLSREILQNSVLSFITCLCLPKLRLSPVLMTFVITLLKRQLFMARTHSWYE
ncbi:expressed unknown protein [Seminavis robusta]|uniref:Uncharacterized protein n=1 Tax=Seminavis robusta TaxID=568900 RepID=A0A9N8DP30_9STRA|nr:expressed unknown protein [Seminavis robusta]|eukprot:Sro190_g082001.1  (168) ;mRNA; f:87423-87926